MATVKKAMKTGSKMKKAQYGEHLSQDSKTGKYTLTTKSNTSEGPRYYQSTSPSESMNRTRNNFLARANSADSVKASNIDPKIISRLSKDKNGGKMKKAKSGGSFPDLNKDGKITKADILKGRGVIAKSGMKMKKK